MVRLFFGQPAGSAGGGRFPPAFFTSAIRPAWFIAGIAALVLVAGVVLGLAWARKTVTLADSGKEIIIKTRSSTVGELLAENSVQLGPHDRVVPELPAILSEGSRVEIKRAHRVQLTADRETVEFYSSAETVGDVLRERKVALNGQDMVSPSAGERIGAGTEIRVVRVRTETEEVMSPIAHEVRRVPNHEMARGISRTVSRGQNGEEIQTWSVTYHDDQVVSRSIIDRKTVVKPVEAVVHTGTGQTVSRGGENIRFREAMDAIATAYTHTGYNTASGTKPHYGVVAVDPRVIPLGTRLYVDGYGHATALDTGSVIKGNRIDVFLESESEARRWGVRTVRVYILD